MIIAFNHSCIFYYSLFLLSSLHLLFALFPYASFYVYFNYILFLAFVVWILLSRILLQVRTPHVTEFHTFTRVFFMCYV
jgi:hypothetical protein